MRKIFYIVLTLCMATSCVPFPTEWFEPKIEENDDYHNLKISAEGDRYKVPFEFMYYTTKTMWPMRTYPIRCRFIIDDIPGEIYDAASSKSPITWYHDYTSERTPGIVKAFFDVIIPANESSLDRTIAAQISIDNIAHSTYEIQGDDEHDWGEWKTVLDGIQAGR